MQKSMLMMPVRKFGFHFALLIIIVAVILNLAHLAAVVVESNESLIESLASKALKHPVNFEQFTVKWVGGDPLIDLRDVTIENNAFSGRHPQLHIEHFGFSINILQSLLHMRVLPDHLFLEGAKLTLRQNSDRDWQVVGIGMVDDPDHMELSSMKELLYWLATQSNIIINQVSADIRFNTGKKILLKDLKLQVRNNYLHHDIVGVGHIQLLGNGIKISKKAANKFRFVIIPTELQQNSGEFSANFYVKTPAVEYRLASEPLIHAYESAFGSPFPLKFQSGKFTSEIWGKIHQGELAELQGKLLGQGLVLNHLALQKQRRLDRLMTGFYFKTDADGWKLAINPLNLTTNKSAWHFPALLLQHSKKILDKNYQLHFDKISVAAIKRMINFLGMEPKLLAEKNHHLKLSAILSPFNLWLRLPPSNPVDFEVNTSFKHLNFSPYSNAPGMENLSGNLRITPEQTSIKLDAAEVVMNYPYLFSHPFKFHTLQADMVWQEQAQKNWTLDISKLKLDNGNLQFQGDISLAFFKNQPLINLNGYFQAADVGALSVYVPHHVINKNLQQWLTHAFQQGIITNGIVRMTGIPGKEKPLSHFHLALKVQDLNFLYSAEWPQLIATDALLVIDNNRLTVSSQHAITADNYLHDVFVKIPDLINPILFVQGQAQGNVQSAIQFLQRGPFQMNSLSSHLKGRGAMTLNLKLKQSLNDFNSPTKITGQLHFLHDKLQVASSLPAINNLQGDLSFNDQSIIAKNITGTVFNQSLNFRVSAANNSNKINLDVKKLQALDADVTHFELKPVNDHWQVLINNPKINGFVVFPTEKTPIWTMNFKQIKFDFDNNDRKKLERWRNTVNPSDFPAIKFSCDDSYFNHKALGSVLLQTHKIQNGIKIDTFKINNTLYSVALDGQWTCAANECETMVNGNITNQGLGDFLRNWKVSKAVNEGYGETAFELKWPGAPYKPSLTNMSGNVAFNYIHGRIERLSNSAESKLGLGRLLTLLNLQSLPQNLLTGFTHFGKKGFEFSVLKGKISIKNGVGHSDKIELSGPLAWASINGDFDFSHDKYNLNMKVVPNMTSSLPVIVGLAGGPIAGIVAWLVNQVVASKIGEVAATEYHLKGSIQQPKTTKRR